MKKLISTILTVTTLVFGIFITPVKAENKIIKMSDEWITVNLISASIPTTYKSCDYSVLYTTIGNTYTARIIENKTGKEVSKYNETIEGVAVEQLKNEKLYNTLSSDSYITIIDGTFNLVNDNDDFKAYVWVTMKISYGSYWKECSELLSYGHSVDDYVSYTLEDSHSFDGTMSYPTSKVRIDMNGVIQEESYKTTPSDSHSIFPISWLEKNKEVTTTWYERQPYNTCVTFIVMN